jgi:hypothetical protein
VTEGVAFGVFVTVFMGGFAALSVAMVVVARLLLRRTRQER